jgi:hypothetical protein
MDSILRLSLYSFNLDQALANEETLVIFGDIPSGRFVQIAVSASEQTLIIDIPVNSLSDLESQWLGQNMDAVPDSDGNPVSYQKMIPTIQIDYAADYLEWLFTIVFRLRDSFSLTVKRFT